MCFIMKGFTAVTAPRGRQGWEAPDRIFVLHLPFVSPCQCCCSAPPAQDLGVPALSRCWGSAGCRAELDAPRCQGSCSSCHGCQAKESLTSACSSSMEPPQPSRAGQPQPRGHSWSCPGTISARAARGASSRLAEQLPQGSTPWEGVSQSSGFRETSNTPAGLAGIFIHLHVQICSTFSLYKYMGAR